MVWVLAAALAAGITCSLKVAVGAFVVFVVWVVRSGVGKAATGLALIVAVLFGLYGVLSIGSLDYRTDRFRKAGALSDGRAKLVGWVSSFPVFRYGGMAFSFRTRIDGVDSTILVRSREYVIAYGDSIRVSGRHYIPKPARRAGYAKYLFGRGLCGEIRLDPGGIERLGGSGGFWLNRTCLWPIHDRIRRMANRSIGSRCGIAIALLLGEKGYLQRGTRKAFVQLGISHLLALSGLHLGFVAAAILLLFRVTRRRSGFVLVFCLALYVGVVGCIMSLYRAFVMAVVIVTAAGIKRPIDPLRALAIAFVVVLLAYPFAFYSVGFQLSFLATLGVLIHVRGISPPRSRGWLSRIAFWAWSSLSVSVAAQLIVAPLVLSCFGKMSLLSPVATLIFVLPVGALLVGLGACAVITLSVPALEPWLFGGLGRIVEFFRDTLVRLSDIGPEPAEIPVPSVWLYYIGVAMFLVGHGGRVKKTAGACIIAASLCLAYT